MGLLLYQKQCIFCVVFVAYVELNGKPCFILSNLPRVCINCRNYRWRAAVLPATRHVARSPLTTPATRVSVLHVYTSLVLSSTIPSSLWASSACSPASQKYVCTRIKARTERRNWTEWNGTDIYRNPVLVLNLNFVRKSLILVVILRKKLTSTFIY